MTQLIYNAGEDIEEFFRRIDACGGWPHDRRYVVVEHTVENIRPCHFSMNDGRDEWNTPLCSVDKYYWWKMSQNAKQVVCDEIFRQLQLMVKFHEIKFSVDTTDKIGERLQ